ncbi:MAG: DUF3307 domain-containing protein [Elusimicrobia bacterium]|nr:DUF3307 domain-containing protein [Elusimicrobiota bacterium]
MIIFWRLILGHLLADFTLQSNLINEWKRSSLWGMMIHCLTHPLCYVALTFPLLSQTWLSIGGYPINGWWSIVLITITHYLEDTWRIFTIKRFKMPDNTLYLMLDQIIHVSVIVFFGIGAIHPTAENIFPEKWPILAILAIIVTHFSVVLIYFFEKDFFNKPFPNDWEKYLSIIERALAFIALAFLPELRLGWPLAIVFLLVPRISGVYAGWPVAMPPNISWALGSAMTIACGLLGRALL